MKSQKIRDTFEFLKTVFYIFGIFEVYNTCNVSWESSHCTLKFIPALQQHTFYEINTEFSGVNDQSKV